MSKLLIVGLLLCALAACAADTPKPSAKPQMATAAPDFALPDTNGKTFRLADYRGKPVVLNFWAFWCDTWKAELPHLRELARRQEELGFRLLTVSVDGTRLREFQAVTKGRLPFPALLDVGGKVSGQYHVAHVPTVIILDADGKIRDTRIGYPGNVAVLNALKRLTRKPAPAPLLPLSVTPRSHRPARRSRPKPSESAAQAVPQRVTLVPKQVTFYRDKGFRWRKATVSYPVVTGLHDKALLTRIQQAISPKTVFGRTLEEMKKEFETEKDKDFVGLEYVRYHVHYNNHALLDMDYEVSFVGAYPSVNTPHVLVSLKTGRPLRAGEAFKPSALPPLLTIARKAWQADKDKTLREVRADKNTNTPDEVEAVKGMLDAKRFAVGDLNKMSVSDKGVTFLYDFGFPHALLALEPPGRYFFSYARLRPFIRPVGPFAVFLR